jgi:polyisoprenoid-binding protein YceI
MSPLKVSFRGVAALLFAATVASPTFAQTIVARPAAQQLLMAESHIRFVSRQMGVPVQGQFRSFTVNSRFDPHRPASSQVSLAIDLLSTEIGSPDTERELRKPGWFDSARQPQATFTSTSVRTTGAGRFDVEGVLAIKGITQNVSVPLVLTRRAATTYADGTLQIRRMDFRIGDGEWNDLSIVANEVQVVFRLALTGVAPL